MAQRTGGLSDEFQCSIACGLRGTDKGGGNVNIERLAIHLANEYPNHDFVTTLVDLYGFSDREGRSRTELEEAIREAVLSRRRDIQTDRVIPYVQQYEFEALLFSDIQGFQWVVDGWSTGAERQLQSIVDNYSDPEQINDNPTTAPSKRLEAIFRGYYRKTEHGPIIAEEIGLAVIRSQCPGFDGWITKLEGLNRPR
ncbi:DUF4276 family protein [Alkalilimnicola ehrlichii MLHE-1]|uniref:DUF4276 family protein n=1 Tax=Alkalilimnicola ehrlichii (strain ATCC BAA-1101 / DSM 17681 / MLHE-1) TaxID=187272 RepID=Q0A682_ALKEH|nr:DUF4276 family protein [Alkalilimnicola ehrlichii]ABI57655.1 hypothetical protein Mlg_2315 [Alkalilimnicola ehrlichii MLHE-1]